jgi:hypothetical protein
MKPFFCLLLLGMSFCSFAQGVISAADKDKMIAGPTFFKLGAINSNSELIKIVSGPSPLLSAPIRAGTAMMNSVLVEMSKFPKGGSVATIGCVGETNSYNGIMIIQKIKICVLLSDGRLIVNSNDLSPQEVVKLKSSMDNVLHHNLNPDEAFKVAAVNVVDSRNGKMPGNEKGSGMLGLASDSATKQ